MSHGDDVEQAKQLEYRYLRTLDLEQWDEFEALFVPEATGSYMSWRSPAGRRSSATCGGTFPRS